MQLPLNPRKRCRIAWVMVFFGEPFPLFTGAYTSQLVSHNKSPNLPIPSKVGMAQQCLQRPASTLDFKPPADGQAAHQQGFQVPRCCGLMAMALHQQHLAGILRHGFHQGVIQGLGLWI